MTTPRTSLDINSIRNDFPILQQRVYGKPLIYLDSAATSQKPRAVIDALTRFYVEDNSNIHRGVHALSERATTAYEDVREKVRRLINAGSTSEIVFVRGATEAINLVAYSFGRSRFRSGDEVVITAMEHHSNIVPWQILCEETGCSLRVAPINDDGEVLLDDLEDLLTPKVRLVAVAHISNALGTINPVRRIIEAAHNCGAAVLIDGAQAAPHLRLNMKELDCDFYVFSSHKMYGPTGVGVLYGKEAILEEMPPWQGGGDMISSVSFDKTIYNSLPYKFEAGTPNIAATIGLGAAIDYLEGIGFEAIAKHEHDVLAYGTGVLREIPGLRLIGTAREKAAVLAFTLQDIHPHDVGTVLDREGIAVRTGHHCAQPVMARFGVPATTRASLGMYNTRSDIDALANGLIKVRGVFD